MSFVQLMKEVPKPGRSYLIRTEAVGPVYDVAFYNGLRKDGSHWWTLTNIEIDARSITHWAEINEPGDEVRAKLVAEE